ncbi:MAG: EamA family transporter [Alphaproteobacteria bacterium]|nr:EamA family transporter [Alphaproteobacteria bacterium]
MNGLWAVFTVAGAAGQTARNAMQRELTQSLGAVGATHVRFLFGFPFALALLAGALLATHAPLPQPNATFALWIVSGALTQIGGTALMLQTMTSRSFVVSIAYLKTEPIFVAILGLLLLKDPLTAAMAVAILIATSGVVLISLNPSAGGGGIRPALFGLSSGALFGISAIGYRGAILALSAPSYLIGASFALAIGLVVQAVLLSAWLAIRSPEVLAAIVRLWRPSLFAGFMGALASEFWFLAFALAPAASVRTLGLVDVLFAQALSHFAFHQRTSVREAAGILMLLAGAILLVVKG